MAIRVISHALEYCSRSNHMNHTRVYYKLYMTRELQSE